MHYYCFVEYLFISSVSCMIKRCINIANYLEVGCVTMYFGSITTQMKRFSVHSLLPLCIAGNSEFPIRFITNPYHKVRFIQTFSVSILLSFSRGFNLIGCLDRADIYVFTDICLEYDISVTMEPN